MSQEERWNRTILDRLPGNGEFRPQPVSAARVLPSDEDYRVDRPEEVELRPAPLSADGRHRRPQFDFI